MEGVAAYHSRNFLNFSSGAVLGTKSYILANFGQCDGQINLA